MTISSQQIDISFTKELSQLSQLIDYAINLLLDDEYFPFPSYYCHYTVQCIGFLIAKSWGITISRRSLSPK